uniref:GDSL esterase/lipase CPRD49-like n=1 Tax=Erigeron canadensis TaxID=72917 RepID=UPI001CB923E4|nr:GDSL esterase/lipase CPRD49-like [Erigeron canadensis]
MVGPRRPQFVLFGSSIVEFSFAQEGWGAILADIYARKADIFLRGYGGWNSRQAVEVLDQVFPKDDAFQPSLVIVYFGGNDSVLPRPDGLTTHVPLPEYIDNMRKIGIRLKNLSEKTRVIFLTAPPVNEAQLLHVLGVDHRKNELCQKYADACVELCREIGIKAINLCNAFKKQDGWLTTCFTDGMHLSPIGSKIVAKEILKVILEAEWKPSLHWEALASEFA